MDVIQYFDIFNKVWQEIDLFNDCEWSSAKDGERYKKIVDKEQNFDVLHGLNKELDKIQRQPLRTKPQPSIDEIWAEVKREQCHKHRRTETTAHIRQLDPSCSVSINMPIIPTKLAGKYMEDQQIGRRK